MNMLSADQKNKILQHIDKISVDDLLKYIDIHQISFKEMKETGKLSREKQDRIIEHINGGIEKEKQEDAFWENVKSENSLRSLEEYLRSYPNGKYKPVAEVLVARKMEDIEADKERILTEITTRPEEYSPQYLLDLFDEKKISPQDLISRGIITERALHLYLNPPNIFTDQLSWSDLKPLPKGKTDVYVFGIPGSGKSCMLAGLFYTAEKKAKISPDLYNTVGVKYMNELKRGVNIGYVPEATSTDKVNYISCSLIDGKREHPISIIEMSGEFFNSTYKGDSATSEDSIGARGYLHNENRKVIFLVIDYQKHSIGDEFGDIATQGDILIYVLKKLDQDGTLEKTDSLQLIVTKSDLMPKGVDKEQYTRNFLNANYLNLVEEIKRLNKQYGINQARANNLVVHPFSLGKFMLGKTYEYESADSEKILDSLINLTSHKRKGSFFNRLRS